MVAKYESISCASRAVEVTSWRDNNPRHSWHAAPTTRSEQTKKRTYLATITEHLNGPPFVDTSAIIKTGCRPPDVDITELCKPVSTIDSCRRLHYAAIGQLFILETHRIWEGVCVGWTTSVEQVSMELSIATTKPHLRVMVYSLVLS